MRYRRNDLRTVDKGGESTLKGRATVSTDYPKTAYWATPLGSMYLLTFYPQVVPTYGY